MRESSWSAGEVDDSNRDEKEDEHTTQKVADVEHV